MGGMRSLLKRRTYRAAYAAVKVPDVDIDSIEFDYMGGSDEYDFDIRSDTSSDL